VVLCALAALTVPADAQGNGVIAGMVINGTTGGDSTGGLEVTLRIFEGTEEQAPRTTTTDAQGRYRFEGLDTGEDRAYLARVVYANVVYSGGLVTLTASEAQQEADIIVYETTSDSSVTQVGRAHVFVTAADAGLAVTELYVFENASDRTYLGVDEVDGRRWAARFELPASAQDLVLDDGALGGRFLSVEGGFVDTEPQWPGTTQVLYSYVVACPGGRCDLSRTVAHPIANLNALVADVGAQVESDVLVFQGTQDAQGQSYLNYSGRALSAGARLDLTVLLPGAASVAPSGAVQVRASGLPWIILITVVSVLPLVYPFWRRRIETSVRKGT
jgi:hypothetical protein